MCLVRYDNVFETEPQNLFLEFQAYIGLTRNKCLDPFNLNGSHVMGDGLKACLSRMVRGFRFFQYRLKPTVQK